MPSPLSNLLGDILGPLGYALTKVACHARNWRVPRQQLPEAVREEMRRHFPALDLDAVRICAGASLPPNWFSRWTGFVADGMALGTTVFLAGDDVDAMASATTTAHRLLMHELVHVEQVRRLGGEFAFARAYGRGVLASGSYRNNPLEHEAYELIRRLASTREPH